MNGRSPPAVFVMGPTASGKTDLAVALHERFPVEVVSVDSAMVYRGMDIGTAKPTADELVKTPHRLVDICEPSERYSAARFRDEALAEMAKITAAGRIPLLVGGTMLYFRALQHGLSALPQSDPGVRSALQEELDANGLAALHRRLANVDPVAAARIHANDPQRTLRALEVWEITGRRLSEWHESPGAAMPYAAIKLVRAPQDRAVLHERIGQRFEAMLGDGLVEEVKALVARGDLEPELPSMRSVGYRQVWAWLRGECRYDEMVAQAKAATRQLAKRQMTWLRSEPDVNWLTETQDVIDQAAALIESGLDSPSS